VNPSKRDSEALLLAAEGGDAVYGAHQRAAGEKFLIAHVCAANLEHTVVVLVHQQSALLARQAEQGDDGFLVEERVGI